MDKQAPTAEQSLPPTVSHLFGEMTWLLSQSPLHRELRVSDLEWLIMPALLHQQFYLFRDQDKPVGLALWAHCNPKVEKKLDKGLVEPGSRLSFEDWRSGDRTWLVDLVAPFADQENRQREIMFADLISGPLAQTEFRFHRTDPMTGERTVQLVSSNAGQLLKAEIDAALSISRH